MRRIPRTVSSSKALFLIACWALFLLILTKDSPNPNETKIKAIMLTTNSSRQSLPSRYNKIYNRTDVAIYIEHKLADSLQYDKGRGCDIPNLDPFSKEATADDWVVPPLVCDPLDWVKCYLSKCRIMDEILKTVSGVNCQFRDIIYINDFRYTLGPVTYVTGDDDYELLASDHVNVMCLGTNKTSGELALWSANTLGFRPLAPPPTPPGREGSPDVVIFLFDSASKTGFIRLMPQTWKVLNEVLGATVMHGFNIIGDGTTFALFPLLTGKTELELPDVRRLAVAPHRRHLDDLPFIFYKLKENGYRTAYFEDMPVPSTFQYRFQGFMRPPADHYLRAFQEAYINLFHRKKWNDCLGDTPQYKVMMNITEQFLELDGKHFIVTFVGDISHEDLTRIQLADGEMAAFLRRLAKWADDTLIIVMGDHGPRFQAVRARKHKLRQRSFRGKLDERLPLLTIRLPKSLRSDQRVQQALEANSRVLTTVHDLHATILDVLDMRQYWNPYRVPGADSYRGLTMLETIPRNRSCSEAGVDTHWCTCLVWEDLAVTDPLYDKSAQALVDYINWLIQQDTGSQCVSRTLVAIRWVSRKRANDDLLAFSGAANYESYLGRFSFNTQMTTVNYNIGIVADPGGAEYEASMVYFVERDVFIVLAEDISRTNSYKGESDCIVDSHPHLAAYCYCATEENVVYIS